MCGGRVRVDCQKRIGAAGMIRIRGPMSGNLFGFTVLTGTLLIIVLVGLLVRSG